MEKILKEKTNWKIKRTEKEIKRIRGKD